MFKIGIFVFASALALTACNPAPQEDKVIECTAYVSEYARIIMNARQQENDKDELIDLVVRKSEENDIPQDIITWQLLILEEAYLFPVMDSQEEKEEISREFGDAAATLCNEDPAVLA